MAATIQELQITVGEDMRFVFMLQHDRFVEVDKETGELLCDTKLLGFFSSEDKCGEAISHYKQQPGFKDHLEGFTFKKVEADIDDYNDIPGTFEGYVYFLSHEWYDGEFDYVSYLGYYSKYQGAEEAQKKYCMDDDDYFKHQEGFVIDKYAIDQLEWKEGFCASEEMNEGVQEI